VDANLCKFFFIVSLDMYCRWKSSYQEGRVVISLTVLCIYYARTWISHVIFMLSELM